MIILLYTLYHSIIISFIGIYNHTHNYGESIIQYHIYYYKLYTNCVYLRIVPII